MLSVDELLILQAGLRFALDQIQEVETYLAGIEPRTAELTERLACLGAIRLLIEAEAGEVAADLKEAGEGGRQLVHFERGRE